MILDHFHFNVVMTPTQHRKTLGFFYQFKIGIKMTLSDHEKLELSFLRAAVKEMRVDVERYHFLRNHAEEVHWKVSHPSTPTLPQVSVEGYGEGREKMDSRIDAEIKEYTDRVAENYKRLCPAN